MTYYIVTNISEDYNIISNLAKSCKMEVIDYLKYSIQTGFNVSIQNIKIENTLFNDKNVIYDVISNNYDEIKDFIYQYFKDDDHYDLIHKIVIE